MTPEASLQLLNNSVVDATNLFYQNCEDGFAFAQGAYENLNREYPGDEVLGSSRGFNTVLTEEERKIVINNAKIGAFLPHQETQLGGMNMIDSATGLKTRVLMHTLFSGYPKLWAIVGRFYDNEYYNKWLSSKEVRTACPYEVINMEHSSWYPQTTETFNYIIIKSLLNRVPTDQATQDARYGSQFSIGLWPLRQSICENIRSQNPNFKPGDKQWDKIIIDEWPKRIGEHFTPEMQRFANERQTFAVKIADASNVGPQLARLFDNDAGYKVIQQMFNTGEFSQKALEGSNASIYERELFANVLPFVRLNGNKLEEIKRGVKGYLASLLTETTFVAAPLKSLLE